ncbi:renin receptor-like [Littorina saxatilis]|uniref:Renin receptor n=1 Tax=Littorina saxatilis TaxID=31220 RepID=A0AAN9G1F0_9CAEN
MKMAYTASIVTAVLCFAAGSLAQQLILTHAPSYVTIQEQSKPLSASDVPDVISHTLGLSDSSKPAWSGLKSGSMFKRPKANVLLTVVTSEGSSQDIQPKNMAKFPVDTEMPVLDMNNVMNRVQSAFLEHQPLMLDLMADSTLFDVNTPNDVFRKLPNSMRSLADRLLDSDSVLSRFTAGSLNRSHTPDLTLMTEMQMVDQVVSALKESKKLMTGKTPDLFSFVITGLKSVSDSHGPDSQQTKDAHTMLSHFIDAVTKDFRGLYKDNVVVEVLTVPAPERPLVRKTRSLLEEPELANSTDNRLNLAWDYHSDFPAMFNIILWMSVLLIVVIFIISYGMWNIDPGRDSIIYRMTSQRLKKD